LDLGGRVALVTGASGGIGAGIARRLVAAGADVVAHYRGDPAGAAAVAPRTVGADLTEPGAAARLLDQIGLVDVVVHNAADQRLGELAAATPQDWSDVLAVNVEAVAELTREAASRMIAAGRPGSFVMIASIEGLQPAPAHGPYAASKAALLMYTLAAASEYGRHGIRCNAVCPGLVDRPGLADDWPEGVARWQTAAPLERLGTPADIGDAVAFLASDLAAWVSGATLVVDGGVLARPTW
jgi:NAD(P)-dependent dehydrogenase (short-subunit alcohol dehydrogenase family)